MKKRRKNKKGNLLLAGAFFLLILFPLFFFVGGDVKLKEWIEEWRAKGQTTMPEIEKGILGLSIKGRLEGLAETEEAAVAVYDLGKDLDQTPPFASVEVEGNGEFLLSLPPLDFYRPLGVMAYLDKNDDGHLSGGEPFVWALPEYRFMATEGGMVVGDAPRALEETEFVIDFSRLEGK